MWWAKASAKTRKFQGLGDGFQLISGLCGNFWNSVHPLADDGDQDVRVGNLT